MKDPNAPPHRDHVVVQLHGGSNFKHPPAPWASSCVVMDRWRLLDGKKLSNLDRDPLQHRDVSTENPEVVSEMRAFYEAFWASVSPRMTPVCIDLGNPAENPTELCSHDWYMETGNPPWNFGMISRPEGVTGLWHVEVKQAGRYRLTLRQYPAAADKAVNAVSAKVRIAGEEMEQDVEPGSRGVDFEIDLPAGKTTLETWLRDETGDVRGAYFTVVELLKRPER